jgi:hypothetical protein
VILYDFFCLGTNAQDMAFIRSHENKCEFFNNIGEEQNNSDVDDTDNFLNKTPEFKNAPITNFEEENQEVNLKEKKKNKKNVNKTPEKNKKNADNVINNSKTPKENINIRLNLSPDVC